MRQRAESDIEAELVPIGVLDRAQRRQRERSKLREHLGHRLADAAFRHEHHDLCVRMAQKQAQEFRAGVTGCAEYADVRLRGTACCRHDLNPLITRRGVTGRIRESFSEKVPRTRRHGKETRRERACGRGDAKTGGGGAWKDMVGLKACSCRRYRAQNVQGQTAGRMQAQSPLAAWYALVPLGTPWRSCFCLVDGIVEPSAGADSPLSH